MAGSLEQYFAPFRDNIVGISHRIQTPYGEKPLVYADWTASGRVYRPIEERILNTFAPFVGNTHSETNLTGTTMTHAYREARRIIKEHVNAGPDDVLITMGTGMTGVVNKFQRILGLRVPDQLRPFLKIPDEIRPVVFVTHMEHHSNHTSWLETIADVVCLDPDERGLVDPEILRTALAEHKDRRYKIGSFSACSNVTGITTDYHALARVMHEAGGLCFVDFAASGPYVEIDMHPADPMESLDAIFFSPHKFLGGPGSPGVLVFNGRLYNNSVPDDAGGGTVVWTNPWGHRYWKDIETREDGGTPGFLQTIRAALAIRLKEEMGVQNIHDREAELLRQAFDGLRAIPGIELLAGHVEDRLPILSFVHPDIHFNLMVRLLNDRYGVQTRGGCACAGTYGHYLLHVDQNRSQYISEHIDQGDTSVRLGWVRMSLHPTTTDDELTYMLEAIAEIVRHRAEWSKDYNCPPRTIKWNHPEGARYELPVESWFDMHTAAPVEA